MRRRTRERGKDLKRRKARNDIGKARKKYAGKKVKGNRRKLNGKVVYYKPVPQKKTIIKLYCWKESQMSIEGYRKFPFKARSHIRRLVYGRGSGRIRIDASVYDINTRDKLEYFFEQHLTTGVWMVMGFGHGKNKVHVKPVKLCKVRVSEVSEEIRCKMVQNFGLFRRWWWKG